MEQYNEKIGECYRTVGKEIAELNAETLKKYSKNIEKIAQAKPEDFITTQIELLNSTARDTVQYWQEASQIWLNAILHTNNTLTNVARDARETIKKATTDTSRPSKL